MAQRGVRKLHGVQGGAREGCVGSYVGSCVVQGVANYHPDWDMESQFLTNDLHRVMDLDSTINSHPIVQEVNHPDQITEIFDTISYAKGASVLRMLEQFMGPEEFRQVRGVDCLHTFQP